LELVASLNAALVGRYVVEREIGAGGMATVYLARDLRHQRAVALKVLDRDLGAALGAERFLSEIRVTASLQHPNLLPLFDSGDVTDRDGSVFLFYVMPFVEGETLRRRLVREKLLPVDEAIRIATTIAGALDYAHRHGVIHRDLKPENILFHDGQPLVADFGIALAVSNAAGPRMTQTGLSLGTPQYMAPEQAMGDRTIDARADIYALGTVTYEMLTGEPPFTGPTAQAVAAKVITERASAVMLSRASVPAHVDEAIARALEKLPADRFQSAAEFARAISAPVTGERRATRASWVRDWRSIAALTVASAACVGFVVAARGRRSVGAIPVISSSLVFPAAEAPSIDRNFAVSPDGSRLAYVTPTAVDGARLWIKSFDDGAAHPIIGTEGAVDPFWSPDGASIGFFANGHLHTVPAVGGAPTTLGPPTPLPAGGAWNRDGIIVFNPSGGSLFKIPATGGTATLAVGSIPDVSERRPVFLPDQRHVLFWDWTVGDGKVWLGDIVTGTSERLHDAVFEPAYDNAGLLLFSRAAGQGPIAPLFVQPFDLGRGELTGKPVMISALLTRPSNWGAFSFADNVLVFANLDTVGLRDHSRFTWWGRDERKYASFVGDPSLWAARASHDGRHVAFGGFGLWINDVARNVSVRVPTKFVVALNPVWSPGDSVLAYSNEGEIRMMSVNGGSVERTISVQPAGAGLTPVDWSPDGQTILYLKFPSDAVPSFELWGYSTSAHTTQRVLDAPGSVLDARFSPDGRWIAYESDQSGSNEIYLGRYPQSGAAIRVSSAGGGTPRWRADGRELYFIARDGRIMAASIQLGTVPTIAPPAVLVAEPVTPEPFLGSAFEPMPDGTRFLLRRQSFTPPVLQMITGWHGLVQRDAAHEARP
jgi:eukaryotic-like serine/threonine-protein kinase